MNGRRVGIAVGVSVVVALLVVGGLLAYPVSERAPRPADQAFEVATTEPYAVTAAIVVDGTPVLSIDGAATDDGERYVRIAEPNTTVERYRSAPDARVYSRYLVPEAQAGERVEYLRDDSDQEIVETERTGGRRAIVTVAGQGARDPDARTAASVVTTELRLATYAVDDTASSGDVRVLEPQAGWYRGSRPYRLTDTAGTVRIDPATNVVYAATVSWKRTVGTESYLHYLVQRSATIMKTIRYEYRTDDVTIRRPEWAGQNASASA